MCLNVSTMEKTIGLYKDINIIVGGSGITPAIQIL